MIAIAFFISLASLRLNNRKTLATSQTHEKREKRGRLRHWRRWISATRAVLLDRLALYSPKLAPSACSD
jgi:hypothetical protein